MTRAPVSARLTRLAALPAARTLVRQARALRRETPRLPDAAVPWSGSAAGPRPVRLLVLGDSTAAGVGASTQDEALPGWLARGILERYGRGSAWVALGENGATARDVLTRLLPGSADGDRRHRPDLPSAYDLIMLTIGANDALGLRSRAAFSRDVRSIVLTLRAEHPRAVILVSLMPRFDLFDLLPSTLAAHAMNLDDGARSAVSGLDRVIPIRPTPGYSPGFFASDRFHPGPDGYRMWADFVLDETGTLDLDG